MSSQEENILDTYLHNLKQINRYLEGLSFDLQDMRQLPNSNRSIFSEINSEIEDLSKTERIRGSVLFNNLKTAENFDLAIFESSLVRDSLRSSKILDESSLATQIEDLKKVHLNSEDSFAQLIDIIQLKHDNSETQAQNSLSKFILPETENSKAEKTIENLFIRRMANLDQKIPAVARDLFKKLKHTSGVLFSDYFTLIEELDIKLLNTHSQNEILKNKLDDFMKVLRGKAMDEKNSQARYQHLKRVNLKRHECNLEEITKLRKALDRKTQLLIKLEEKTIRLGKEGGAIGEERLKSEQETEELREQLANQKFKIEDFIKENFQLNEKLRLKEKENKNMVEIMKDKAGTAEKELLSQLQSLQSRLEEKEHILKENFELLLGMSSSTSLNFSLKENLIKLRQEMQSSRDLIISFEKGEKISKEIEEKLKNAEETIESLRREKESSRAEKLQLELQSKENLKLRRRAQSEKMAVSKIYNKLIEQNLKLRISQQNYDNSQPNPSKNASQ